MNESTIARVYLERQEDGQVVLTLPNTNYRLHLRPTGLVTPSPQGRVRGVIRCRVWKLDHVSAGGGYIQPLYGRPRRVQGEVIAVLPETNSIVLDIRDTPIVADLPPRYNAADIPLTARVGLDVHDGATFEPHILQPTTDNTPHPVY